MPKSTYFTFLLNIDIDIAIFCKYRIDIILKLISIQYLHDKLNDIEAALITTGRAKK